MTLKKPRVKNSKTSSKSTSSAQENDLIMSSTGHPNKEREARRGNPRPSAPDLSNLDLRSQNPSASRSEDFSDGELTRQLTPPTSNSTALFDMKTAARPYRSHKFPACSRCHKRRSRCTIEIPGQPCLLCRMHGVPCSSATAKSADRAPKVGFVRRSMVSDKEYPSELSHIVGPIISRDTHVLEQYLPPSEDVNDDPSRLRSSTGQLQQGHKPVYHSSVPQRRSSPTECLCTRNLPQELSDRVEPFADKLTALYFEHLHPCFPMVDETCVATKIADGSLPLHYASNLYAYTMFYSELSPALAPYARPDQDFCWQAATVANNHELTKCDLSIVMSGSTNIAGRPSTCVVSNTVNVSRIVALSHSMGLNHDATEWKMSEVEKQVRHKTWWTVLLHDRLFAFANGTPSYITKGHYDAPMPTVEIIVGRRTSTKHVQAAECYVALCHLTEIIGDILPLIYQIRSGNDVGASEQTSRSEIDLNRWIENLPSWLQLHEFEARPSVPGLCNLQLSYLAVRMLLRRIAWHEISQRQSTPNSSWLLACQAAADEIVRFIKTLHGQDYRGFWLPYNAHHFTSALTLLLRCALQTTLTDVRQSCMTSARSLVAALREANSESNWDLAEACLPQCESFLRRIEEALPRTPPLRSRASPCEMQVGRVIEVTPNGYDMENGVYLSEPAMKDTGENWQMSIEELFPEIFSDFSDTALYEGSNYS